jgi:hypothetical protein
MSRHKKREYIRQKSRLNAYVDTYGSDLETGVDCRGNLYVMVPVPKKEKPVFVHGKELLEFTSFNRHVGVESPRRCVNCFFHQGRSCVFHGVPMTTPIGMACRDHATHDETMERYKKGLEMEKQKGE